MTFISYAQNGEDVILWRALNDVAKGFYIDVGACDPDELSVTKAFYDRGWSGVNIEPAHAYFERCVLERPRDINLNVAVLARSGIARFLVVGDTGLSTTVEAVAASAASKGWSIQPENVPALSLSDICESLPQKEIHFLKIDVEGAEQAVLEGADFSRFRPWIVIVEATVPLSTERNEHLWEKVLLAAGYECTFFDGVNLYFLAQEHSDLRERLAAPPNALDDFQPVRLLEAESRVMQLAGDLGAARSELQEVHSELGELRQRYESQETQTAETAYKHAVDIANVRAENLHLINSAQTMLDFITRRLAKSSRRIVTFEQRILDMQGDNDSLRGIMTSTEQLLDVYPQASGATLSSSIVLRLDAKLKHNLQNALKNAETIKQLHAQHEHLKSNYSAVCQHRDALLSSSSWRLSAPLRKFKAMVRVAAWEPRRFVPLVLINIRRKRKQSATYLPATILDDDRKAPAATPVVFPLPATVEDNIAEDATKTQVVVGSPQWGALDYQGQMAALIRHDLARRRLARS